MQRSIKVVFSIPKLNFSVSAFISLDKLRGILPDDDQHEVNQPYSLILPLKNLTESSV
jgi:hypothetical protein